MIHAYLFVTKNNRDRDGHGPEFHKHMYRINEDAGTKISVYHDFHDEVRLYKTHWWRCNGPCQNRRPYFGMIKRASNRAPGPNDRWFPEHERSCGGKFMKVREPDTKKKGQLPTKSVPVSDIRNYGDKRKDNPFVREMPAHNVPRGGVNPIKTIKDVDKSQVKGGTLNKGGGTIVVNGNSQKEENPLRINNFKAFSGAGHSLASTSSQTSNVDDVPKSTKSTKSTLDETDQKIREQYANVRDFWTNKYTKRLLNSPDGEATPRKRSKSSDSSENLQVPKCSRSKSASDEAKDETNCPICSKLVNIEEMNNHLDNCLEKSLDDDGVSLEDVIGSPGGDKKVNCLVCQKYLSSFELNQHLETCINNVFEDEFEEPKPKIQEIVDLESDDNSSSDDVTFIEDREPVVVGRVNPITGIVEPIIEEPPIVIEEDVEETIVIIPTPARTDQNLVLCPCCPKMMFESEINAHLDVCLSQTID